MEAMLGRYMNRCQQASLRHETDHSSERPASIVQCGGRGVRAHTALDPIANLATQSGVSPFPRQPPTPKRSRRFGRLWRDYFGNSNVAADKMSVLPWCNRLVWANDTD